MSAGQYLRGKDRFPVGQSGVCRDGKGDDGRDGRPVGVGDQDGADGRVGGICQRLKRLILNLSQNAEQFFVFPFGIVVYFFNGRTREDVVELIAQNHLPLIVKHLFRIGQTGQAVCKVRVSSAFCAANSDRRLYFLLRAIEV